MHTLINAITCTFSLDAFQPCQHSIQEVCVARGFTNSMAHLSCAGYGLDVEGVKQLIHIINKIYSVTSIFCYLSENLTQIR